MATIDDVRVSSLGRISNQDLVAEYRRLDQLVRRHSDGPGRITSLGWDFEYLSLGSVLGFIDFILFRRMNDFLTDREDPVILDCGANVGFTVLNYKRLHPRARITAFEPDPGFAPILRRNLTRNGAEDVEVVDAAVWTSPGHMPWVSVGTDGSRLDSSRGHERQVPTIDLLEYLDRNVDLLKIDIEGAEFDVVPHLAARLHNVRNILVECHLATPDTYARLGSVIATLQRAGFAIGVNSYGPWRDLTRRHVPAAWHAEQYLLVAGWREHVAGVSSEATFAPYSGIAADLQRAGLDEALIEAEANHQQSLVELATGRRLLGVIALEGPFRREHGYCWMTRCPQAASPGDSGDTRRSSLVLVEDDAVLGPSHAVHEDIRTVGGGRYSHWGDQLYLSTSDNSDPNTNGRAYRVVCQRQ